MSTGITERIRQCDDEIFAQVAKDEQVWILVRATNVHSLRYIGKTGFLPKPVDCKPKTADLGGAKAGLVVSPLVDPRAFSGSEEDPSSRCGKALKEWAKFVGGTSAINSPLPAGYSIQMTPGPLFGCLMLNGNYLYGDYDLYDVIDPNDPLGSVRLIKRVRDKDVSYSPKSLRVQRALNAKFPSRMVQHGDQLSFDDHTEDLIYAFPPEGASFIINLFQRGASSAAIEDFYRQLFPGRGSRKDVKPRLVQVK